MALLDEALKIAKEEQLDDLIQVIEDGLVGFG